MNSIKIKHVFRALLVVLGVISVGSSFAGTDILAEYVKPEISSSISKSSYAVGLTYAAEAAVALMIYIKTRKWQVLLGILLVMLYLNVVFKITAF